MMLKDKVTQKKLDALCARYLHEQRLARLKVKIFWADVLAVIVPVAYVPIRLMAKGTQAASYIEVLWAITAAVLAIVSLYKLVSRWSDTANRHSKLIGENISIITQADYLLSDSDTLSTDKAQLFFLLTDTLEKSDRDVLGIVELNESQCAYREALKESVPHSADIKCPICNSSPWLFKPGSCQACGNTPERNKE